jgi:hypothetical protein
MESSSSGVGAGQLLTTNGLGWLSGDGFTD